MRMRSIFRRWEIKIYLFYYDLRGQMRIFSLHFRYPISISLTQIVSITEEMEFHENFIPKPEIKALELNDYVAIIIICGGICIISLIVFIFELFI